MQPKKWGFASLLSKGKDNKASSTCKQPNFNTSFATPRATFPEKTTENVEGSSISACQPDTSQLNTSHNQSEALLESCKASNGLCKSANVGPSILISQRDENSRKDLAGMVTDTEAIAQKQSRSEITPAIRPNKVPQPSGNSLSSMKEQILQNLANHTNGNPSKMSGDTVLNCLYYFQISS